MKKARMHVLVPMDSAGDPCEVRQFVCRLRQELETQRMSDEIAVIETGRFGPINKGVSAVIHPDGTSYVNLTAEDAANLVEEHFVKGRVLKEKQQKGDFGEIFSPGVVLKNCGRISPDNLNEYLACDGWKGLETTLHLSPGEVRKWIMDSGLRGRGGAGFPTGKKWQSCADAADPRKIVVCNADEGEPGTFKDRLILEGDPFKVIEGMIICAYAVRASEGFIYIRGEYSLSINRIKKAIKEAREAELLGMNILGSGFSFDIRLKIGAGAYVCGEETALLNSMEGKPGNPRIKPPYPTQSGYLGHPTVVNNVETLANIPSIMENGADWFSTIGAPTMPGTKVYAILGKVNHPGLIEVPTGIPVRSLIENYGGGMKEGSSFKAVQLGGTGGDILSEEALDLPLDIESLEQAGHVLGAGALLVLDRETPIIDLLYSCMRFFVHESCGRCNVCRNGGMELYRMISRMRINEGVSGDIELLEEIATALKLSSFCPLGTSTANPILSAIRYFRSELEGCINSTAVRPSPIRNNLKLSAFSS